MKRFFKGLPGILCTLVLVLSAPLVALADMPAGTVLRGWNGTDYQYVRFGNYESGSSLSEGILWRVLGTTGDRALLMSEYILATRSFDSENSEWKSSAIKKWLNGTFLKAAFSARADYEALHNSSELGRVFLLSKGDFENESYGFSRDTDYFDDRRRAMGTYNAINEQLWESYDNYSSYYTRTSRHKQSLYQIRSDGSIGVARIDRDNVGIRPAVTIYLDKVTFSAGDGTIGNPYR